MWTTKFWTEALERAVKSGAQAALLFFGADKLDVLNVDWTTAASLVAGAAVLSVLTSIVSANIGPKETPSLVD